MSAFSELTVLSAPTAENKDWSFMLGELKFEVHESMVELTNQIKSFESFARSVNVLIELIDHIDNNNGKLDKGVYEFVNQNNELAQALGIIIPYSFATEEEQQQAGEDVKKAAEGNGEEKGFFAKAWETICKFFKSIGNAVARAWNSLFGDGTEAVDNEVKKLSDTVNNAGPELDEAFELKYNDIAHQGLKYTSKEIDQAFAAISAIAKDLSNKYKTGSWEEIFAVAKQASVEFIDENAVESLLTAFHYVADNDGNIHASEVKADSQNKCLLDYGIDRSFCQNFEQKWQQVSNDVRTIQKVVGILQKGIAKYSDEATVEKFVDSIVHDKQNILTVAKTNYDKPKRGLGNKFKRAWGSLVGAFNARAGAKIERSTYTTQRQEYTTTEGEERAKKSGEKFKAAMAIGQIQANLASNTLKIAQIALKDVREFVKSVNNCLDSTKDKKGRDSEANQNKYRKEFYANQKNNA